MPAAESSVRSVPVIDASEEDALLIHKTQPSWNTTTTRARVRGLSRNPALPDTLVPQILEHSAADVIDVMYARDWSDELFDIVAAHPSVRLREALARCARVTAEQRVRMVGDPDIGVVMALLEGPFTEHPQPLPAWAYRKLAEHPGVKRMLRILEPGRVVARRRGGVRRRRGRGDRLLGQGHPDAGADDGRASPDDRRRRLGLGQGGARTRVGLGRRRGHDLVRRS